MRPPRSILVLTKYRFMGDTVVATPLLRATRRVFPHARITLFTGPSAATVLQHCPFVDRFVPYDPYHEHKGTTALVRMMLGLRKSAERPDLCLVADRSVRSAIASLLCGGRIRAGFDSENRGPLLSHRIRYDADRPEIECYLDILRAVAPESPGAPRYDPSPQLWVSEAERARGTQILREREALGPVLVGIQPGASYSEKQWPSERFALVADDLARHGGGIVLLGGPNETEAARKMRQAMRAPAVDLTGATGLRETLGVLGHLSLFVGNDTGVNHMAAGLQVPTVALFGPTSARKWGNTGPHAIVLKAPAGRIDEIAACDVVAAGRRLLRGDPAPRGAVAEWPQREQPLR